MTLGENIKKIRLDRGMTLEQFGDLFDANKGLASSWESNRYKPSPQRLKAIADLAGTTVAELLSNNQNEPTEKEHVLSQMLQETLVENQRLMNELNKLLAPQDK